MHSNIDRDRFYAAITFLFMHLLVSSVHGPWSMVVTVFVFIEIGVRVFDACFSLLESQHATTFNAQIGIFRN